MRTGKPFEITGDGQINADMTIDWRDNPSVVMEAVDRELKQHGLEVVTHETDSDFYAFSIQPIKG